MTENCSLAVENKEFDELFIKSIRDGIIFLLFLMIIIPLLIILGNFSDKAILIIGTETIFVLILKFMLYLRKKVKQK